MLQNRIQEKIEKWVDKVRGWMLEVRESPALLN